MPNLAGLVRRRFSGVVQQNQFTGPSDSAEHSAAQFTIEIKFNLARFSPEFVDTRKNGREAVRPHVLHHVAQTAEDNLR